MENGTLRITLMDSIMNNFARRQMVLLSLLLLTLGLASNYTVVGQTKLPLMYNSATGGFESGTNLGLRYFPGTNVVLVPTNFGGNSWGLIINAATSGGSGDAGGTNARQFGSLNLTNWSNIATGDMANIPSVTFLTNWANAISNLAYMIAMANSNLSWSIGTDATNYTLTASNNVRLVAGLAATNHAEAILQSATNYANGVTNSSIVRQAELTTASNVLSSATASKQHGSILLSNLLNMGISNILAADGIALATNGGVLWITNTASAGAGGTVTSTWGIEVQTNGTVYIVGQHPMQRYQSAMDNPNASSGFYTALDAWNLQGSAVNVGTATTHSRKRFYTAATDTTSNGVYQTISTYKLFKNSKHEFLVIVTNVSNVRVWCGLSSGNIAQLVLDGQTPGRDFAGFRLSTNSANLFFVTSAGGANTATDTGFTPAADATLRLGVELISNGSVYTSAIGYTNGVACVTNTTNLPDEAMRRLITVQTLEALAKGVDMIQVHGWTDL